MGTEEYAVIISAISVFFVIFSQIATNFFAARAASAERREARRKEWIANLKESLNTLIELRAKLQPIQEAHEEVTGAYDRLHFPPFIEQQVAYAKAYGIILSVPNSHVSGLARKVMEGDFKVISDPNHPEKQKVCNEKLDAIDEAIGELGALLGESLREK